MEVTEYVAKNVPKLLPKTIELRNMLEKMYQNYWEKLSKIVTYVGKRYTKIIGKTIELQNMLQEMYPNYGKKMDVT